MPNCFQLLRGGVAVPLAQIDDEMCRHFGAEPHPTLYYEAWYDAIGWELAMGRSFQEIRDAFAKHVAEHPTHTEYVQLGKIVDWLEQNFTPSAWHERKGYERTTTP